MKMFDRILVYMATIKMAQSLSEYKDIALVPITLHLVPFLFLQTVLNKSVLFQPLPTEISQRIHLIVSIFLKHYRTGK